LLLAVTACGSCYKLPKWDGEVHVTPLEREAVKSCNDGRLTMLGTRRITREPYLQSTTTTSTIVAWGSKDTRGEVVLTEPSGNLVRRAPAVYAGNPSKEGRRRAAQQVADDEPIAAADIYVIAAKLEDLEPTHLYCYQVLVDGVPLTERAPLNTAAAPGLAEPIRWVTVGDTGTGGPAQHAIEKRMTEVPFEFMLFLGDIAYTSGTAAQLNGNFFAVYKNVMKYVPVFPTLGNHERRTKEGRPYLEAFVLPEPERYYSFDWGDVHFVAIDTTKRDQQHITWLAEDLAKNTLPWVVVYGHHPMYTNSLRGPQLWIRKAFAKVLTDHDVDLVVTGHEHQYERFRVGGVNYIVSGGGGGQLTKFFGKQRSLKQATVHHYLAFEATGKTLTMKAIDITGKEIETLTLSKKPNDIEVKTDGHPDIRTTPVPPETHTKPDEKLHDEPDDDKDKIHVAPPPEEPTPIPVKPQSTSASR
jgi:predicted MPP superfamily phosphohydrolase